MSICTLCGEDNREGARFCNGCGAPLAAGPAPSAEVRKVVTVLFCDVVGSTQLGERFDPEVLRGLMSRFYTAIREPVERHGGTVEKVIGDALVAVFGIPSVQEDDALRAVRAAIEMRDAVRAIPEIEVRIGINTGDVLAGNATAGESLMVGDAVNVAARLEQAAGPGEVLVGEATWMLIRHAVRGELVAPIAAKGKTERLVAWRLEGVDPLAGGHVRRLDLPMIGREPELQLVRWALERTREAARPHLVTVLGQAGIGKSRLVLAARRLDDGFVALTGHCRQSAGASSLDPLLQAAREAVGGNGDIGAGVAELMGNDPDAGPVAACLQPGATAGAADVGWAVSRLLGAMLAATPVLLVIEDVHWADDALLDALEQLAGRSRRHALLVLCTGRPEFAERRPAWGTGANASTLVLERLDDDQTRRLLTRAGPALAAEQAEGIVALAEGNPLFAEHLAALVEEGKGAGRMPRSIQVLLTARLEALPADERQVVGIAAVAGREFPVGAVESLVGRSIEADLEHLARRELVEPAAEGRWQFGHTLLQEAAYGLIPKLRRSELHEGMARWGDANGAGEAIVADHLARAAELRGELGETGHAIDALREEAGTRLVAAGRRADALGDPVRARNLIERALGLLAEGGAGRAAALVELVAAGWNLLPDEQLRLLLDEGARLAAANGLRALELRAGVLRLSAGWAAGGEPPTHHQVVEAASAALAELDQLDDGRALATALITKADAEHSLGRAGAAVDSCRRAVEQLRIIDEDTVWAVSMLALALEDAPTPVTVAEALLGELMTELGMRPAVRLELMQGQAMLAQLRGDEEAAWRLGGAALELERDLGRRRTLRSARNHARMLMRAGRFDEAVPVLVPLTAELERVGADVAAPTGCMLAVAYARIGSVTEAREAATSAALGAAAAGGYWPSATAALALSELHIATGEADEALRRAREAVEIADTGDWVMLRADARMTLARALRAGGGDAAAAEQARDAAALLRAKGAAAPAGEAEAFLGSLALAES